MLSTSFHRTRPRVATRPHRFSEDTTSAAVICMPWWNLTSRRSVIVWRSPRSPTSCDSASSGIGLSAWSYVNSDSKTCHMISYVRMVVDIWMSSVGGSPIVAILRMPPVRGVSSARRSPVPSARVAPTRMRAEARTSAFFIGLLACRPQRRLGLIQPESHVHLAVHRRGSREMFAGIATLFRGASVELAETQVAIGHDRTHAQFASEGHGLPVGGFSLFRIGWVAMCSDLAQSAERPRFLVPSLAVAGEIDSLIDQP